MADIDNCVFHSPYGTMIKKEHLLDSGTALPGYLLTRTATGVVANSTADSNVDVLVADLSVSIAGAFDTEYNTTDNQIVNYKAPFIGEIVSLRVGASQKIAIGAELTSAGDGTVKIPASAGVGVSFKAETALTTGAGESGVVLGRRV